MSLTIDEIKVTVLVESIRQCSNRRITNRLIRICEKYKDNVVIGYENENDYWINDICYTNENGDKINCAIVSENEFDKMIDEIFD